MAAALVALLAAAARGTQGGLKDPTFGAGSVDPVTSNYPGTALVYGGTADAQGRAIPVGALYPVNPARDPRSFFVAKYHPDGILQEATFGFQGTYTGNPPGYAGDASAQTASMQSDGKVLVGGYARTSAGDYASVVLRLNANGTPDNGFASSGWFARSLPDGSAQEVTAVQQLTDGRIVFVADDSPNGFTVGRLNGSGQLDPSFGSGGLTSITGSSLVGYSLAVQPDGKVVVGGGDGVVMAAWRLRTDGTLDPSFGNAGEAQGVSPQPNTADVSYGLVLQPDGKIVLGGGSGFTSDPTTSDEAFALERFSPTGVLDTSFGTGGMVRTQLYKHDDEIESLLQAPDGDLVAVGLSAANEDEFGIDPRYAFARYTPAGVLDQSFGVHGVVVEDVRPYGFVGFYNGAAMLPDGRFYAFGPDYDSNYGGVQARYLEGSPTVTFSPASGRAGDVVHVTANDVAESTVVRIGSVTVPSGDIALVSPTRLDVTIPATASTGPITVATVNGTGTSSASLAVLPRVDWLDSAGSVPIGGTLGITGSALDGTTNVTVAGIPWKFTVDSPTHLTLTAPANAVSGTLAVTTPSGSTTSSLTVSVAPEIGSFLPRTAAAGQTVTLSGEGLGGDTVTFGGGVHATVTGADGTSLQVTVPPTAGSGPITVQPPAGPSVSTALYFRPQPRITSVSQGREGDVVTITGTNLLDVGHVALGRATATFTTVDALSLTAVVPAGVQSGSWTVTGFGRATSATWMPAPTISSFGPGSGPVGTSITITGLDLRQVRTVRIGGTTMRFRVVSATRLVATVPGDASSGVISVTSVGGTTTSADVFDVT